uniref:cytochrome c biogenesis protein transmembrane region n=1 Tax=Chroothece richteriana TaxID=101928 RepID=UPI001FCD1F17|nr:cytochrome c biogenesis protein transmembrane region [Chroothece richteriana]UNJ14214.1 cytochrome c biogenesis protein transmembrane region [Chroothece richteriana]
MNLHNIFFQQTTICYLPIVFISGVLNSLNPCSASSIPIVIYCLNDKNTFRKLLKWVTFALGNFTAFLAIFFMQRTLHLESYQFNNTEIIAFIYSCIYLFIGLLVLEILPVAYMFTPLEWLKFLDQKQFLLGAYLSGVGLGCTVSSCSTPILLVFLLWLNNLYSTWTIVFYEAIYAIGYSFAFLLILLLFSGSTQQINNYLWTSLINSAIGILFVGVGVYYGLSLIFH